MNSKQRKKVFNIIIKKKNY